MELEQREDPTASDRAATQRSPSNTEREAFTVPFASEGLEGVRDSHC